ncbi:hypothetical protein F2Q70_00009386 [Brassica cretica]|uniref:Uncharacterized protein n=1 Tax=Brassica cretica TaxID=69181 RepID=A0A8S9M4Z8_BRACR|nr:hypothetical protein F2Q70_00009386 [Brassica cretica]
MTALAALVSVRRFLVTSDYGHMVVREYGGCGTFARTGIVYRSSPCLINARFG